MKKQAGGEFALRSSHFEMESLNENYFTFGNDARYLFHKRWLMPARKARLS
jgi:hypothetical protein